MNELALPGAVTATALDLRADLSYDEWADTGRLLGRIGRACQWWIGDWLNYGEQRYGEKYAQAMDDTRLEYQTLADYAWVASAVEPSLRNETLSWWHHREVAKLEPAEQQAALTRAAGERLSVRDLRRELHTPKLRAIPEIPEGRFAVLYADPPWRYEHVPVSESRAVENQYPTMELEEIKALRVPAAENAVLFLWATNPKLLEAFEVIEAWGFEYRTSAAWVKDRIGMGYYFRQQHELLLVAKRGEPPTPAEGDRPPSVVTAPRGRHSEKPEEFYGLIERMYPTVPRIELFARKARADWEAWGNEEIAA